MTNNAILISATDGVVSHRFCTAYEANRMVDLAAKESGGASAHVVDPAVDVATGYAGSPELKELVGAEKTELRRALRITAALDKHNVPEDRALRGSIYAAMAELREF